MLIGSPRRGAGPPKTTNYFIETDPHIFAAFFKKDEEYNTFIIQYHKDIYGYQQWREGLVKEGKLPPREIRYPSDSMFFSNQAFIKYNPSHPIELIGNIYNAKKIIFKRQSV